MKFHGEIGYGETVETEAGVWEDVITEVEAFGDVVRNTRRLQSGEKVNDDLTVSSSISVLGNQYANEHFFAIKYVKWMGTRWKVTEVTPDPDGRPRLFLNLGEVYNGPLPA